MTALSFQAKLARLGDGGCRPNAVRSRGRILTSGCKFAVLHGLLLICWSVGGGATAAPPGTNATAADAQQTDSEQRAAEINRLVDELASPRFIARERASESLFLLGYEILPELREIRRSRTSLDPEQRDRLKLIIRSLAADDLESRIESFLRGEDSQLENWEELRKYFGDSPRVRQMFVELYRTYPDLIGALGGNAQELMLAVNDLKEQLKVNDAAAMQTPKRIDLLAFLLPMTNPNFTGDAECDFLLSSMLQMYPANEFRRDRALGEPFKQLVAKWMIDSDFIVRDRVLRLGMEWKLDVALQLAMRTLAEDPPPRLVARCLQTIALQGAARHLAFVATYLDDERVVLRKRYLGRIGGEVQVGDVAAAAIAYLSSVPVTEIGFAEPAEHDIFGIIFEELVIAPEQALRQARSAKDAERNQGNQQDDESEPSADEAGPARTAEQIREEIHAAAKKLVPDAPKATAEES
jgi:hypothetical protein